MLWEAQQVVIYNGSSRQATGFKSGLSIDGSGVTYELDKRENENGHFVDTPGKTSWTQRPGNLSSVLTRRVLTQPRSTKSRQEIEEKRYV